MCVHLCVTMAVVNYWRVFRDCSYLDVGVRRVSKFFSRVGYLGGCEVKVREDVYYRAEGWKLRFYGTRK